MHRRISRSLTNLTRKSTLGSNSSPSPSSNADDCRVPKDILPHLQRISTSDFLAYMDDKVENNQDPFARCANKLIQMSGFSSFMCLVILLNTVVLIIETDEMASKVDDRKSDITWTEVVGWIVLGIFIFELILRIFAFRRLFWNDMGNVFDFLIVSLDACFSIVAVIAGSTFPLSILRVFRLAKFARVSKVLLAFPELRLLLAGLISSMSAIFWGTILLLFFLIVWSMVAVLFINPLNREIEYEDCERCGRAYSSVMHACLSFWQSIVTGDSWGRATIPLIEKHPETAVFFIAVYLTIGMAVTNLILGVVVSVAQQARHDLMLEESAENTIAKLNKTTELFELCKDMDLDNSGFIDKKELLVGFAKPGKFRDAVLALDIGEDDLDLVWTIMDPDNKGEVSYKELVSQLASLRSSDSQFMLCYIKYYITTLKHKLIKQMTDFHKESLEHELNVEAGVQEMEKHIEHEEKALKRSASKLEELLIKHSESNDDIIQQVSKLSDIRQAASTIDSPSLSAGLHSTSATVDEHVDTWVQRICDDIAKVRVELTDILRLELKEILLDMNGKLGLGTSPLSSMSRQIMSTRQPEVMVIPGSSPNPKPPCCHFPFCSRTGQLEHVHVLGTAPEMISEASLRSIPDVKRQNSPCLITLPKRCLPGEGC